MVNMGGMFNGAESFDQDISEWCVEQISSTPLRFDDGAGFEGDDAKQPNWGGVVLNKSPASRTTVRTSIELIEVTMINSHADSHG
jgi:hypothetical protein